MSHMYTLCFSISRDKIELYEYNEIYNRLYSEIQFTVYKDMYLNKLSITKMSSTAAADQ